MKVVLIGSGNVGRHLGKRLKAVGADVLQVFSRNLEKAEKLAQSIDAQAISKLSEVDRKADLYILAVHDDAISLVAESLVELGFGEQLMVHTSGATPQSIDKSRGMIIINALY